MFFKKSHFSWAMSPMCNNVPNVQHFFGKFRCCTLGALGVSYFTISDVITVCHIRYVAHRFLFCQNFMLKFLTYFICELFKMILLTAYPRQKVSYLVVHYCASDLLCIVSCSISTHLLHNSFAVLL